MKDKRTYRQRARYLIEAVKKRRKKLKELAVKYKGGKCCICGYNKCLEALEFHHLGNKDFGFSSRGITRSWNKLKKELDKCILVCANCHRELHAGIIKLQPSGVIRSEKNGVKCGKPKALK